LGLARPKLIWAVRTIIFPTYIYISFFLIKFGHQIPKICWVVELIFG
jgi:hypothetical protein